VSLSKKLDSLGRKRRPRIQDDFIVIRINKKLKRRFWKCCKKRGEKPPALLRKYIMKSTRNVGL